MTLQRAVLLTSSSSLYSPHRLPCYCSLTKTTIRRNAAWRQSGASYLKSFDAKSPIFLSTNSSGAQPRALQGPLKVTSGDDVQVDHLEATTKWIADFAAANFLPIALITGVLIGLAYPRPGQIMQQWGVSRWTTSTIFVISGLTLKTGDIVKAAKAWPAALFGVVSILFITPLAAIPVLRLQLSPRELVTGLAIFCCVPTTLSSGVSLTQLVGANTALALALTIISNLLGILTMPYILSTLVGRTVGVSLPAGPLLKALVETLLVPLLLGKLIRELSGWGSFLDQRKKNFSILSSFLLSLVPWMQTSCSREMLLQIEPSQILTAVACGICIHAVYLAWNSAVMWYLPAYWGNEGGDQVSAARAVILVASQKTLPVLVAVVARLGGGFGEAGLLVLPCIATHLTQIMVDSMLVNFWLNSDKSRKISTA